jgi:ubiquinone/menaquinone biosynthesis C-methylase UbiE
MTEPGLTPQDRVTQAAFDTVAEDYARLLPDLSAEAALEREVLATFAVLVGQGATVLDVGCGTGRVAAHLTQTGLRVIGLDLSEGMLRQAPPELPVFVAHAGALPVRSGSCHGVVAWYSLINLAPALLPGVFEELARVTTAGGPLVLGFQSGDGERVDRASAYGHPVPITYWRHHVGDMTAAVTAAVTAAGFGLHSTVRREAELPHETAPQAFALARRLEGTDAVY